MMLRILFRTVGLLFAIGLVPTLSAQNTASTLDGSPTNTPGLVFFEKHMRPLLENRCTKCHSAKANELPPTNCPDPRIVRAGSVSSFDGLMLRE